MTHFLSKIQEIWRIYVSLASITVVFPHETNIGLFLTRTKNKCVRIYLSQSLVTTKFKVEKKHLSVCVSNCTKAQQKTRNFLLPKNKKLSSNKTRNFLLPKNKKFSSTKTRNFFSGWYMGKYVPDCKTKYVSREQI